MAAPADMEVTMVRLLMEPEVTSCLMPSKSFLGGMNVMLGHIPKRSLIYSRVSRRFRSDSRKWRKIGEFLIFFGDAFASVNISRHLLNATVNQSDSFRITFELS